MIRARKAIFAAALMLVAALVVAGPAAAKDRNNDRIPDHWEKQNRLSLEVKQTKRDQDRDGLNNLSEFRSDSNPRSDDSDDDGTEDGDENAGTITSLDGTTLTIDLFGGGSVTGTVDESTEVKCGQDASDESNAREGEGEDGNGHDGQGDDEDHSGPGHDGQGDENGDDECTVDDLAVDVVVHEAELHLRNGAAVFDEIELAR